MTARTVNGSVLRGIFEKALAGEVSDELGGRLADVGVDLGNLAERYPFEVWLRAMELTATELFPGQPQDEALKHLGAHVVRGLQRNGVIKGPFLTMAKLMGPRRALREVASRTSAESAWLRMDFTEAGPRACTLTINDGGVAELFAGALEPLIELLGGKRAMVTAHVHGTDRCELDIRWH